MSSTNPASAWQPPAPEQLDEWLDRYTVRSLIGRGGMGAVYLAWQGSLDRQVAIKLLPAELGSDTAFVKRFEREAKAMARLDHPNIVRVFDFGRTAAGHFYFVMEHVDGCDVAQLIRRGEVPVPEAMEIVTQLCAALGYAHQEGIIHRDIKPSNILLDRRGRVKIADFGLARPASEVPDAGLTRMTESGMVMGTLEYMAPEQLMGKNVDHRADLYAVGVLFYELLTGDVPRGAWRPPSTCRPMDSALDGVVQRALQPKPEERYQQAAEVERDLTTVIHRKVPPVRAPGRGKVAASLLMAGAVAGGVWYWVGRPVAPPAVAVKPEAVPSAAEPAISKPAEKPVEKPVEKPAKKPAVMPVPPPETPQETKPVAAPVDEAAAVDLPALPAGSRPLADFSAPAVITPGGGWSAANAAVQGGALVLRGAPGPGSVAWEPDGKMLDLSAFAASHWQIEARLAGPAACALLLTLEDDRGRSRSWRLKAESFFEDRVRRHAHRLSLSEAELKSLAAGVGPRFDTPGFDLARIARIRLESDPAGTGAAPLAWRFHRIWLMPPGE